MNETIGAVRLDSQVSKMKSIKITVAIAGKSGIVKYYTAFV